MNNKLQKLLDYVTKEEDKYYNLGYKEIERNNQVGNMVCTAQASAFGRVRYAIEDLMGQENK